MGFKVLHPMDSGGGEIREYGVFQFVDIYQNLKQLVNVSFNKKNI